MGFEVAGPDRFLASGHPPPGESPSPHLGLIESNDAGETWRSVSLDGRADFHVLRADHGRVYAYDGLSQRIMLRDGAGERWVERRVPAPVLDLAVSPSDPDRLIVAVAAGLLETEDSGESWRQVFAKAGLLAWAKRDRLLLVDEAGILRESRDGGRLWRRRGDVGGRPVAFTGDPSGELYVALEDGTVVASSDGGASWSLRVSL